MDNKKKNETLEQQRKARAEFLKLKQMQQGKLAPEPKPSEVAYVPKTFGQKLSNFWFHYKAFVISAVALALVLSMLISQCAKRVKEDIKIIYFTYSVILDEDVRALEGYFEKNIEDLNGDGKTKVTVINCSYPTENKNVEYRNMLYQKMQTALAVEEDTYLIITDTESINYFYDNGMAEAIFEGETLPLNEKFYKEAKKDGVNGLPSDLQVTCRQKRTNTKDKFAKDYYRESKELYKKITE